MKKTFSQWIDSLTKKVQSAYENGISIDEAERLASELVHARLNISAELKKVALDCRMRKAGLKSIRSAVRLAESQKADKKPTESTLDALVDTNELVQKEQDAFDTAEVNKEHIENDFETLKEALILYRGIAKGKFEG